MKKNKLIYVLLVTMLLSVLFVGCEGSNGDSGNSDNSNSENNPLDLLWEQAPPETVAILINQPTKEQLHDFAPAERLMLDDSDEKFLLSAAEEIEEIVIWEIEFNGSAFVRKNAVYNNFDPDDDFILELVVIRPEGGPHYELAFISDDGETSYFITYNGKDGTPDIEYINY